MDREMMERDRVGLDISTNERHHKLAPIDNRNICLDSSNMSTRASSVSERERER
jgi:hypothetical protein